MLLIAFYCNVHAYKATVHLKENTVNTFWDAQVLHKTNHDFGMKIRKVADSRKQTR